MIIEIQFFHIGFESFGASIKPIEDNRSVSPCILHVLEIETS